MYLLTRPPYLRWTVAAMLVVVGLATELTPSPRPQVAIATVDIEPGMEVDETTFVLRDATDELLRPGEGTATRPVSRGSVVTPADLTGEAVSIPDGWLAIVLEVPSDTPVGAPVVAVVAEEYAPQPLNGIATERGIDDGYGTASALVAFAPRDATVVARALATSTVTVLVGR